MVEFVAAAAAGAHALFSYNRSNFFFDQEMRIKREYQGQDMRIKQFELYREDVRDLVGLTIGKMDNYLIVNTLQLGFVVSMYCEGRLSPKTPPWLLWLYTICLGGAFMYLILSVWLAMHASIAAHSFGVRMLTQFVRLPVPSSIQLNAARAFATDFEGAKVKQMLRVPIWKQQAEKLKNTMAEETKPDSDLVAEVERRDADQQILNDAVAMDALPVTVLQHIRLYRQLQANWQSYDAYARVCMSVGTNQLLHALSYYCLGFLIVEDLAPWPAWGCAITFTTTSWLLVKLDLYLQRNVLWSAGLLLVMGFFLAALGTTLKQHPSPRVSETHRAIVQWVFALHLAWIIFIMVVAKGEGTIYGVALPTKFRSVLYLDVFGWFDKANRSFFEAEADWLANHGKEIHRSPAKIRAGLCSQCRDLCSQADVQLKCWDRGREHLEKVDLDIFDELKKTFKTHKEEMEELIGSMPTLQEIQMGGGDLPGIPKMPEWIRLEWYASNNAPMVYHCNVETGETVWQSTLDSDKPVAQSLEALKTLCEQFVDTLHSIKSCPPDPPSTPPASSLPIRRLDSRTLGSSSSSTAAPRERRENAGTQARVPPSSPTPSNPRTLASTPLLPAQQQQQQQQSGARSGIPLGSPISSHSRRGGESSSTRRRPSPLGSPQHQYAGSVAGSSSPTQRAPLVAPGSPMSRGGMGRDNPDGKMSTRDNILHLDAERDNPAQELRFGGREAAATVFESSSAGHFTHSAVAGATFHPEQRPGTMDEEHLNRTPPGMMPYRIFQQASISLIVVWTLGLLWSVSSLIFKADFVVSPIELAPKIQLSLNQSIHLTPPHPFFRIDHLACEGRTLYFGESFKIHRFEDDEMTEICQLSTPLVDLALMPRARGSDHLNDTMVLLFEDRVTLGCDLKERGHALPPQAMQRQEHRQQQQQEYETIRELGAQPELSKVSRPIENAVAIASTRESVFVLSGNNELLGLDASLKPLFMIPESRMFQSLTTYDDSLLLGLRNNHMEHAWDLHNGHALSSVWAAVREDATSVCITRVDGSDVVYVARSPHTVHEFIVTGLVE